MADEDTTQLAEDQATSNNVVFSDEEIASLEEDFKEDESSKDESAGPGEEDEDLEEGQEADEDEDIEGIDIDDEDEEETEESEPEDEEVATPAAKEQQEDEEEDEEDAGFLLVVDGQEIEVDTVDELAALAQKGVFYEKRAAEMKRSLDSANWTMNAMVNDHFGFLEEFYTQKFGGDYESARQHVAKLAHAYVVPYYKELQAEPDAQQNMREKRQLQRQLRNQPQNGGTDQNTFSQQDIEQLQTLEHNVGIALREVGLPDDSEPLRKRMADIMLSGLQRDEYMHPLTAAKHLLKERKALQKELARTAPKKGRKGGKSKKQKKADIEAAKARRSRKKPGTASPRGKRRKAEPSFTGREFLNSINTALDLEP